LQPEIASKIVVVWLGGHALHWPTTKEFNLKQDLHASRLILDCGVPLVLVPCQNVVTHLATTTPEMEAYVKPCGEIGKFLFERFYEYSDDHFAYSKVIWDMAAIAYLLNESWAPAPLVHSPILTDQVTWSFDNRRHLIRYVESVHRDKIFKDFFTKLRNFQ